MYASDFSAGTDGWYARSMGGARLAVTGDGALAITGRSDNWHSPGRDFALEQGVKYALSMQVRQSSMPQAEFMISVAQTANGMESYANLGAATAPSGEWTTVTGTYTAGAFDRFVLYAETKNAPMLDFEIRDFTVTAESIEYLPAKESADSAREPIPSLKEIYADRYDFGTAVTGAEAFNKKRMDFYASQFNIMTPGNELKPDFTIDIFGSAQLAKEDETAVAVKFGAVKPLLDYAKANGIKIHGHVFVWHQQTPEAFFHEGYSPAKPLVSREVLLGRLDSYIRETFAYLEENYPGVVVSYDVVNEAIDDNTGNLRDSKWLTIVGEDYIARAFEIARRHAPEGVKLYYNDYNTAVLVKQAGIIRLLKSLIPEGNIDGYGFQMHHDIGFPSVMQIMDSLARVADTGLLLRVSELDVTVPDNSEESFEKQAKMYAGIMKALELHKDQVVAVQVWGVTDDLSWRAPKYPLLFDAQAQPKPAFHAVADPWSY
ncbi:MAG: endo-1,4-beta-xylanase [Clostridia bacterium]|nr:endo-1,4-beta-xylanase [Clostridia bacterium]